MLVNTRLAGKEVVIYGGTITFDGEGKAKDIKDEVAVRFKDLPNFEYTAPKKKQETKPEVKPEEEAKPKPKPKPKEKTDSK